jgi:uncharacterized protein (DUF58 family)
MIVPRNIIIWCAVLLPFTAAAPHGKFFMGLFALIAVALVLIAAIDAALAMMRSKSVFVSVPEVSRFSMRREGALAFSIAKPQNLKTEMRFVAFIPPELGADECEFAMDLGSGDKLKFDCPCKPTQRGAFRIIDSMFEIKSPLGFWNARRRNKLDGELRIYPDTHSERNSLAAIFLNNSMSGLHLNRMIGQGREFEKLREYVPGDSFDIISWKATAKRGKPISREFQVERTQEVYAVIDTSRFSAKTKNGISNLDHHFSSSLILGQVAEKQGDLFGVITFDDQVRTFIRAKGGKAHYSACRDAIYAIKPQLKSPDFEALFSFIKTNVRKRALLIFLTDLDERSLAELFLRNVPLVSRQHLCLVNMLKDENTAPLFERPAESVDDIYEHLAGHIKWADLLEIQRALAKCGVSFSMIEREGLSVHLVSSYLDMKRRQAI